MLPENSDDLPELAQLVLAKFGKTSPELTLMQIYTRCESVSLVSLSVAVALLVERSFLKGVYRVYSRGETRARLADFAKFSEVPTRIMDYHQDPSEEFEINIDDLDVVYIREEHVPCSG